MIIDMVEARYLHDFFAVQMVFLILVLYYSFSRTECPCPKSYTGRECYDKDDHWNVCDFDIRIVAGVRALFVRFRVRVGCVALRASLYEALVTREREKKWS